MTSLSQPQPAELPSASHIASMPYWRYTPRRGLSIPSITVLDAAGEILEDQQRRLLRHLAQDGHGADIVFGVGTTGEWNRLTNRQRQQLITLQSDEIARVNLELSHSGARAIESWVGVTATTRAETLSNLECALDARADAAVIAPL